jgi:hypothetical protein
MESPILFVNIAWMKRYRGDKPSDPLHPGNFGYFRSKGAKKLDGHEQWNFKPLDGYVYGYAPLGKNVNLKRLGAPAGAKEMDGVLIVFIARDPGANLLKIVGYYENATIRNDRFRINHGDFKVEALFRADATKARLMDLPRNFVIPTFQRDGSGVGESTLWYADDHPEIVKKVRRLVAQKSGTVQLDEKEKRTVTGGSRQSDTEKRLAIEKRSMDMAMHAFNRTEDVSRKRRGWDIEAWRGRRKILIEVKGVSGSDALFELTPNEYKQMGSRGGSYILYVVTGCLTSKEVAHTFELAEDGRWRSDSGLTLEVESLLGARCSAR